MLPPETQLLNTSGLVVATLIDLLIVVLVYLNVLRGRKLGLARQVFSDAGFLGGVFLGVLLVPFAVVAATDLMSRTIVTFATIIGLGLFVGYAGDRLGSDARHTFHILIGTKEGNSPLGAVLSGATTLVLVWLMAALVAATPFGRLATGLQRSLILRTLNVVAPPSPTIVTNLKAFINPNGFPQVFVGIEPWPSQPVSVADQAAIDNALSRYGGSVVHVEGFGCGGLSGGSGFVVAPGLIMTNAHVVAGIKRPFAVDRAGVHLASPVLFDPKQDIALLRVSNLYGPPLAVAESAAKPGSKAVVLGYPEGGPLKGNSAGIMDERTITGLDIYGRQAVERPSYILQSPIRPGGSGSPVVQSDGSVVGMVFARSLVSDQVGFALTSPVLLPTLSHTSSLTNQVSTGSCEP